jgi:hypothetical protein
MALAWTKRITIAIVRAWFLVVLAVVLVIVGLLGDNAQQVFLGFTVLGGAPLAQAKP